MGCLLDETGRITDVVPIGPWATEQVRRMRVLFTGLASVGHTCPLIPLAIADEIARMPIPTEIARRLPDYADC